MPLNLNGDEYKKMTERIAAENKVSVEATMSDGVKVEAGRTWGRWSLAGWFRAKTRKDRDAGVKGEFKW